MDRRTLLAIALSFLVLAGWQELYVKPRMPPVRPGAPPEVSAPPVQAPHSLAPGPSSGATSPQARHREPAIVSLNNEKVSLSLSDSGRWIQAWSLSGFRIGSAADSSLVSLNHITNQPSSLELAFDDPAYVDVPTLQGTLTRTETGAEWKYEDSRLRIRRIFSWAGDYALTARLQVEFFGAPPKYAFVSVGQAGSEKDPEQVDRQLLYWTENSLTRVHLKDATSVSQVHTPIHYLGAQNRYFLFSIINASDLTPKALIQPLGPYSAKASLVYPIAGNSISIPLKLYFGPKELTALRSTDPALDNTVDFGWFTILAYPILRLMKWLYQFVGNYGVAIILLTILLKIVTFPLTYKSMKSMKQMARLQPQLQKLRDRYKDDKEALNRETLSFMRNNGYNPVSGCLPMLIQMPVFFALYRVLYSSIELLHAPFTLWITDLSAHDRLYVTPVLLSLTMFIQQKLTPNTATDPMQAKMLQFMPLIFGAFMLWLPSGLTLYMLVNALASIIQQVILNRKFKTSDAIAPTAVLKAR